MSCYEVALYGTVHGVRDQSVCSGDDDESYYLDSMYPSLRETETETETERKTERQRERDRQR